jgi:hypothetical protein
MGDVDQTMHEVEQIKDKEKVDQTMDKVEQINDRID